MRRLTFALVLALAACGGDSSPADTGSGQQTTSSTQLVTTSSSTTAQQTTTTTTVTPGPLPITDTTRFRAGTRYTSELAAIGVGFELDFGLEGWRARAQGIGVGRFIVLDKLGPEPGVDVYLMAFMPLDDVETLMSWYRSHPSVEATTDPLPVEVGEFSGLTADIRVATADPAPGTDRCTGQMGVASDQATAGGAPGGQLALEIWACTWTRLWVIEVEGASVTMVGMALLQSLDPETTRQIEEFEPLLDDFINAITFCTGATPCDD